MVVDSDPNSAVEHQQTVTFSDASAGLGSMYTSRTYGSKPMEDIGLSEFLKRPTVIANVDWNHGTSIGTLLDINPWHLFFNNAVIKRKIENYAFIRCRLHVKILVNATPFSYGAALATYRPLSGYWDENVYGALTTNDFILKSQRPHVWLYPSSSTGGEMEFPFFTPVDWLRVSVASDFTNMGKLTIDNVTGLWNVNSTGAPSSRPVSIHVYAWAEDVQVSGPTYGLALQSKVESDEYGTGVISAPASAVADFAGGFKKTPYIGKLATATQIGATAVSKMASLFGYSNRVDLDSKHAMVPRAFPNMANCGLEYPVDKLTLDPKNELSVDPSVHGLAVKDELNIAELCDRDTFIDVFTWSFGSAVATDTLLFSSRVNPRMFSTESITNGLAVSMTPMSWVASNFRNWRGDLVFRFRFICTPFHKGRVYISYDPYGLSGSNIVSTSETMNAVKTVIVDLSKDTDVEFVVPYQQNTPFLTLANTVAAAEQPWSISSAPGSYAFRPGQDNGMITMRVMNRLTAPNQDNSNNGIPVIVSVRGKNMEFANPCLPTNAPLSWFAPQSLVDDAAAPEQFDLGQIPGEKGLNLVVMGEKITSLREVLNRRTLVGVSNVSLTTANDISTYRENLSPMPLCYGYDPNGIDTAASFSSGSVAFNFTYASYLNWIAPAFIGRRGSVEWTVNFDGSSNAGSMRVYRLADPGSYSSRSVNSGTPTVTSYVNAFMRNTISTGSGSGGQIATNQNTQSTVSFAMPMISPYSFKTTAPSSYAVYPNAGGGEDNVMLEIYKPVGSTRAGTLYYYASAGTDFNLLFFCNVPTMYLYNVSPGAM